MSDVQSRPTSMSRRYLLTGSAALSLFAMGGQAFGRENPPSASDYLFNEGSSAQLLGTKRVIITDFVVVFQLDGSVRNDNATKVGNLTLFGGNAKEVAAKMAWKDPDPSLMQEIADAGLAALKADFAAKGIEVLDESVLASQPAYASILAANGLVDLDNYNIVNVTEAEFRKSSIGPDVTNTAKIVSAKGLKPYAHSVFEGGICCQVSKSLPSSKVYYVPGFEIDLAKALDAVVVKAWQYVDFTQVSAAVTQSGWAGGVGGAVVNYDASAKSVVRIAAQKTRLSFRLPTSKNKTRNVPTSWLAKDGDVVVSLGKPLLIGDQYFALSDTGETAAQGIRASLGGTQHFNVGASLTQPDAYKVELGRGLGTVLAGALATALGQ